MAKPPHQPHELLFGGDCRVPREVAICPECESTLHVYNQAWCLISGRPIATELQIDCVKEYVARHRRYQSDWQEIIDVVSKWANVIKE